MFPTISEYNRAIQTRGGNVFRTLYNLTFVPSRTVPVKIFTFGSGSYAVVFKANDGIKPYAIRCFISAETDNIDRCRAISNQLKNIKESWVTEFELIENEILVNGQLFPIIKMEWVEGQLINNYINQILNNTHAISELQNEIQLLSRSLERNKIGHGDIQCGNILIIIDNTGKPIIKLIDYDGMYISNFENKSNLEKGRTEFQHPKRTQFDFNEKIDRFSFWVILTALEALKFDKSLWLEVMQGGFNTLDNLLFTGEDYNNPYGSMLFKKLKSMNQPSLNYYVEKLFFFIQNSFSSITEVELFSGNLSQLNTQNKNKSYNVTETKSFTKVNSQVNSAISISNNSKELIDADKILRLRNFIKNQFVGRVEKIERLKELLDSGTINIKEFESLKSEILNIVTVTPSPTPTISKPIKNKPKRPSVFISIVLVLIIAVFIIIYTNTSNNNSSIILKQTNKIDTNIAVNKEPLTNNLNDWLIKVTGYNFNLDLSKIKFTTTNYVSGSDFKFQINGVSNDPITTNLNPTINYYNDYIKIEFSNGWQYAIFLTPNVAINSVHKGTSSESDIYNLNTKSSNVEIFEVSNINGYSADIFSSGHDEKGNYVRQQGILDLVTFKAKWADANLTSTQSDINTNNSNIENAKNILNDYYSSAEIGGNLDNLNNLFADNLIVYQDEHNISKDKAILSERKYLSRWSLLESSILDFSLLENRKYHYKTRQKLRFVKDPSIEKTFEIEGYFIIDENNKINSLQDEKTTRIQ